MKTLTPILCMALLAGIVYFYLKPHLIIKTPVAPLPQTINIAGCRPLHNLTVVRCDADGFVVSAQEGTYKLYNRNLTPEMYNHLKSLAPEIAPASMQTTRSLMESHSLLSGTPTPGCPKKR